LIKSLKEFQVGRGDFLSYASRLTLLETCLASIPIYLMSIIKFPKWVVNMINSHMARFLWNNNEDKHKYHLAHWQLVAQKKELGGLGIPDLRNLNLALLSLRIFKYGLSKNAIWTKISNFKYKTNQHNICCPLGNQLSPFWKGVTWALLAAHMGIMWKVGDGKKIRF